jgi:Transglycosylase SLT domain
MTHSPRSLASLLRDGLQTLEHRRRSGAAPEDPDYLLLEQGHGQTRPRTHPQSAAPGQGSHATDGAPTRQEVLNYLGELAKDYHLPPKLVYAVADAESSVNPKINPQPNYEMRHGKRVLDKHGNPKVVSWDYGLMQINSPLIGHDKVRDADGHRFLIGEEVKHDWRANARAGVAIIKHGYEARL